MSNIEISNAEKSSASVSSKTKLIKAKGFTLIELMIVIAILGVLMSVGTVSIGSFIRNANIRAYNDAARQGFAALQNCLVNWEIMQDNNAVDLSHTNTAPVAVELRFNIISGRSFVHSGVTYRGIGDAIFVVNRGAGGAATSRLITRPPASGATTADQRMYLRLARQISDNLGSGVSGRFDVYINYRAVGTGIDVNADIRNYSVDRVVYAPHVDNATAAILAAEAATLLVSLNVAPGFNAGRFQPGSYYTGINDQINGYREKNTANKNGRRGVYPLPYIPVG